MFSGLMLMSINPLFRINDRVISANNVSLEGVDYATAVQVLRDSGQTVSLVVKRRVVLPPTIPPPQQTTSSQQNYQVPSAGDKTQDQTVRVALSRSKKKEDFGIVLGCKIYIKEIAGRSVADKDGILEEGDLLLKINSTSLEGLTLKEAKKLIETSKDKLDLVIQKPGQQSKAAGKHARNRSSGMGATDEYGMSKHNYAAQNLYVQPPPHGASGQQNGADEKNNLARANATTTATNMGIYATRGDAGSGLPSTEMNLVNGSPSDIDGGAVPPRPPLPGGGQNEGNFCMKPMKYMCVDSTSVVTFAWHLT